MLFLKIPLIPLGSVNFDSRVVKMVFERNFVVLFFRRVLLICSKVSLLLSLYSTLSLSQLRLCYCSVDGGFLDVRMARSFHRHTLSLL